MRENEWECGNETEKKIEILYEGKQRHERYIDAHRERERKRGLSLVVDISLKYVRHTHLLYKRERKKCNEKTEEHYDFWDIVAAVLHGNFAHR